jgi:hypothetical protein
MESTGIVAPTSVGLAEEVPSLPAEPDALEIGHEPPATVQEAPAAESEPAVAGPQPAVPAWPWDTPIAEPASVGLGTNDAAEQPDPAVSQVLEDLDDASHDDEAGLISDSIDRSAPAPQSSPGFGAYSESLHDAARNAIRADEPDLEPADAPVPPPAAVAEPVAEPAAATPESEPAVDAESEPAIPAAATEAVATDAAQDTDPASDFVMLDSNSAFPPSILPAIPGADEQELPPLSSYTCEDCVYVETCPNKDQRLPKDCVSFQWK